MLQFSDVSKGYGGDEILDGVSFRVNTGERCGLTGRNGSGKTTLLRLLTGQETTDGGEITMPKGYRLGFLKQHITFTESSVLQEVASCLPQEARDEEFRAEKILSGMGFSEEDMARAPQEFSGGYQLRIHLAKVLVAEPDCLLLDEPTNYLDIVSIRWLERFLQSRTGELIIISHDRCFMDSVTTHTMAVHRKKVIKESGGTEKLFNRIALQEEVHARTVESVEKKREHMEAFVKRFGAKATKASQAQSRKKALENLPALERLAAMDNLQFHFYETPLPGKVVFEADKLCFSYSEDLPIIDAFSMLVTKGERIAVIGKNGRGKSTLLRLLVQELTPQQGTLKVSDNVKVGYFGQTNIDKLNSSLTVIEEISCANRELSDGDVRRIAAMMMFEGDRAKKKVSVLSGGEKSRVLLGKILATPCNLLLLDEPTNHLDMESIEALVNALKEFTGTIVMVTHDEAILRALATKLIVCKQGRQQQFFGGYNDFLVSGGWDEESVSKPTKSLGNPRELRRKLVAERNRAVAPLKKKMERIEKDIVTIEKKVDLANGALVVAAEKSDGDAIVKLSKEVAEGEKAIEELFAKLEDLSQQYQLVWEEYQCD